MTATMKCINHSSPVEVGHVTIQQPALSREMPVIDVSLVADEIAKLTEAVKALALVQWPDLKFTLPDIKSEVLVNPTPVTVSAPSVSNHVVPSEVRTEFKPAIHVDVESVVRAVYMSLAVLCSSFGMIGAALWYLLKA